MPIEGLPGWREAKDAGPSRQELKWFTFSSYLSAVIALRKNDILRAERNISKAIQLHPTDISLLDFRLQLFLRSGNENRALVDAEKMVKLAPKAATGYLRTSTILARFGNLAGAARVLQIGVDKLDVTVDGYGELVAALENTGAKRKHDEGTQVKRLGHNVPQ
ncbi:hypothetical protein HDU93_006582, partial [Gonapodya sp. JEL0774]